MGAAVAVVAAVDDVVEKVLLVTASWHLCHALTFRDWLVHKHYDLLPEVTASVLPHPYDKIDSDFDEIAYQTHIHLAEADDDAVAGFVAVDESSVADEPPEHKSVLFEALTRERLVDRSAAGRPSLNGRAASSWAIQERVRNSARL